jgi:6-phosphogluconolactonase
VDIEILENPDAVAKRGAAVIAGAAREAIATHGRFLMAVSGGRTPWVMLRALANEQLPWDKVHIFQVDERIAPAGDLDRNLTHLRESLLQHALFPELNLHPMPVEDADPESGAAQYSKTLQQFAGTPPVLDLVHLGMGPDGHTASLIPGDPVLNVTDCDVGTTGIYQGRRRMTLTYPVINRARRILWLITGADKKEALQKMRAADPSIPAGRIRQKQALILADRSAAISE